MAAQLEVELHLHARVRPRTQGTQRLLLATRRVLPIQRPGDRLEQRRLARAVRTDDPRQPGVERDERVAVLAEVREPEAVEAHLPPEALWGGGSQGAVALLGVLEIAQSQLDERIAV